MQKQEISTEEMYVNKGNKSCGIAFFWNNHILLTHHPLEQEFSGKLGIPKGRQELYEENQDYNTAHREVLEEIGIHIDPIQLVALENEKEILKINDRDIIYYIIEVKKLEELGLNHETVPPHQYQFAEVDWAGFMPIEEAYEKINPDQRPILERYQQRFGEGGEFTTLNFKDGRVFVNSKDVGLFEFHQEGDYIEIDKLYINEDYQKQGLGRRILVKLFDLYPHITDIIVYPLPSSEPYWMRFAEGVSKHGDIVITPASLDTGLKTNFSQRIPELEKGGVIEGQLHAECNEETGCGEKFEVGDSGKVIEAERDEGVIVSKTFDTNIICPDGACKYEAHGTPSQIASALNVLGGGKNFDEGAVLKDESGEEIKSVEKTPKAINTDVEDDLEGGSIIINRRSMADKKKYFIKGTPRQIASAINSLDGNGVVIEYGAEINK